MRITLCNGVATFDNGAVTGRFPGEILEPDNSPAHLPVDAIAAE
jgi:hypothetical protein